MDATLQGAIRIAGQDAGTREGEKDPATRPLPPRMDAPTCSDV